MDSETALRWMPQNLNDSGNGWVPSGDKPLLDQCWPRFLSLYALGHNELMAVIWRIYQLITIFLLELNLHGGCSTYLPEHLQPSWWHDLVRSCTTSDQKYSSLELLTTLKFWWISVFFIPPFVRFSENLICFLLCILIWVNKSCLCLSSESDMNKCISTGVVFRALTHPCIGWVTVTWAFLQLPGNLNENHLVHFLKRLL